MEGKTLEWNTPNKEESIKEMSRLQSKKKKSCIFYLNEKCEIASYKGKNLFNERTEILGACRHRKQI